MSKRRLFVGNFPFTATEQDLRNVFTGDKAAPRSVVDVKIILDRDTGRSRGFGFVELATDAEAADALQLNGSDMGGRALAVSIAHERPNGNNRGGGSGQRDNKRGGGRDGGQRRNRSEGDDGHGWEN